jgi:hypothetical protein
MGCEQSTPLAPMPESIEPLYKNTSNDDNSGGVKVPCEFFIGKHNKPCNRQVLQAKIDNTTMTIEASSMLVLKIDDVVFAVAKQVPLRKGYYVFKPSPVYTGQKPTSKYDGSALYEYASIKSRLVSFVHQQNRVPTMMIVNGERNSFEKYLIDHQEDNDTLIAKWKYNAGNQRNAVTVTEPGHDIGLIIFLVVLADLIETDEQINKLSSSGIYLLA